MAPASVAALVPPKHESTASRHALAQSSVTHPGPFALRKVPRSFSEQASSRREQSSFGSRSRALMCILAAMWHRVGKDRKAAPLSLRTSKLSSALSAAMTKHSAALFVSPTSALSSAPNTQYPSPRSRLA